MVGDIVLGSFLAYNTAALILKSTYTKVENVEETKNVILNSGLYHFTKEEFADKILEDKVIKPSNGILSLGNKKVFFFAGIPDMETLRENVAGSYRQYEWTAIKVNPDVDDLKNYRVRAYDDCSVAYKGNCKLEDKKVQKVKLVLDMDKEGSLFIREKTPEEIEKGEYEPSQEIKDKFNTKNNAIQLYSDMGKSYFKTLGRLAQQIKKGTSKLLSIGKKENEDNELVQPIVNMKEINHQKQIEFLEEIKRDTSNEIKSSRYKIQKQRVIEKSDKKIEDELNL